MQQAIPVALIVEGDVLLSRRLWQELVHWRANYHCEECGRGRQHLIRAGLSGRLNAHHLDHDGENNRLANGRCLCPQCHTRYHASVRVHRPCPPGCKCKRHKRHDGPYRGWGPCTGAKNSCKCGRHKRPAIPFAGGSEACPPSCTCKRHEAKFYGERRSEQACTECGKPALRASPGLCATCSHREWARANREHLSDYRASRVARARGSSQPN